MNIAIHTIPFTHDLFQLRTFGIHFYENRSCIQFYFQKSNSEPQEQLLLELDMYQDIAVAKGSTYDTLNKRMDRCQENIDTVSDDIQRLQG